MRMQQDENDGNAREETQRGRCRVGVRIPKSNNAYFIS